MRAGARSGKVVPAAVGTTLLAVVTTLASVVFACTNLATIGLSTEAGRPGDTIIVTGTSFPVPRSRDVAATPVVVRWGSAEGPVLATETPDRTGTIAVTFVIPEAAPGPVVIVATQRRPVPNPAAPEAATTQFTDEYGTPDRATLRVLAPGERAGTAPAPADFVIVNGDSGSPAMIVMMLLFGAVALSLFGGGVIAFLHQLRSRPLAPQRRRLR